MQSKATVIEQEWEQWRAEATEIFELIRAERAGLDAVKNELVELLAAVPSCALMGNGAIAMAEASSPMERRRSITQASVRE